MERGKACLPAGRGEVFYEAPDKGVWGVVFVFISSPPFGGGAGVVYN